MRSFLSRLLLIVVGVGLCFAGASSLAADINEKAGTSAFPFLKIAVGARAVGMGGAFTGLADDVTALYYNPAGIVTLGGDYFNIGYHNYFVDIQSGFAATVFQLDDRSAVGVYVSYLNYGKFDETDLQGNLTGGTFSGGDLLLAGAYARKLSPNIQVGGSGKIIYEKLQKYSATGGAVDLGLKYLDNRERLGLGLSVLNIGAQFSALNKEKYDLPLMVRAGLSYKPIGLPLVLCGDVMMPFDNDFDVAIGAEYYELKPAYLRLGWSSYGSNFRAAESDDKWAGTTFGVGFDFRRLQIGYAFVAGADLGDTHRVTLSGEL